jgi:YVTN family beta-propeller protein
MDYGRYVGRVGALAVALGIGVAVANGGVAHASPKSPSGDTDNPGANPSASPGSPSDTAGSTAPNPSDPPETKVGTEEVANDDTQDSVTRIRTRARTILVDALDGANIATRNPKGTAQPADRPRERQRANAQDASASGVTVNQLTAPSQKDSVQQASTGTAALQRTLRAVTAPPPRKAAPAPNAAPTSTTVASTVDTLTTRTETQRATTTAAVSLPPEAAVEQQSARVAMGLLSFVGLQPGAPTPAAPVAPAGSLLEFLGGALRRIDRALFNQAPRESVLVGDPNEVTGVVTGRVATDPDNALEFSLTDPPDHGTVEFNSDGTFTYTPDYTEAHPVGQTDSFTVEVSEANTFHLHPAGGDHTITVSATVDVAPHYTVIDTINTGPDATWAVVTPDNSRVYVAVGGSDHVRVYDTATNELLDSDGDGTPDDPIQVGDEPTRMTINPAGTRVYVLNNFDDTMSVINTEPGTVGYNTVIATIDLANPPMGIDPGEGNEDVALSPDGTRLYVTNFFTNNVSVVDATNNTVIGTFQLDDGAGGVENNLNDIEFHPDGTRNLAYIADVTSDEILVIDTVSNTVVDRIATPALGTPQGMEVDADGTRLYVAGNGGQLDVIDISDPGSPTYNTVIATVDSGDPGVFEGNDVTVHGDRVYVNNYEDSTITVIDADTDTVIETIPVGQGPFSVAVSPDGTRLYVPNAGFQAGDGSPDDSVSVVAVLQEA